MSPLSNEKGKTMSGKTYTIYRIEKAIHENNINTALKIAYKHGRGHFNIFLERIGKVSDFKKVMGILAESDNFYDCADVVRNYLIFAFNAVISLRKEKEGYNDDENKSIVMHCDTLIKRYKSFADAFNKITFDQNEKIVLENAPEIPKAKKDSYYIMQFNKIAHEWAFVNIYGFSFVCNGFRVGVHKTPDDKAWDASLLGYGITFGMTEKSKKAAIYNAIDTLKKCNFSPYKMQDAAARFSALAAENNIDISEQIEPPTEPETVAPVEPPTEPETVAPRRVYYFTPISPGERHAAGITPENAAPPLMVAIWLHFASLQKHLFDVSHTLERCHVPVYGFTRLLYTVVALLLYHARLSGLLSGLPLFVVSNFRRDHGNASPCMGSGLSALHALEYFEPVGSFTRLTLCRIPYRDTS